MVSVLKSNRAIRFIHPTEIPSKFLSEFDCNHHQINLSYLSWEEQDQTVFAWILNSIFDSLHTRVIGYTSSSQLWDELHSFCNAHTKARSWQLRAQLRTIIQGNNTISEYFSKIKCITDSLASIRTPISIAEHVDYVLDGLGEEFQTVITAIESQINPPSINDLEQFLLTFESRLIKNKHKAVSDALSANIAIVPPAHQSFESGPIPTHFNPNFPPTTSPPKHRFDSNPNSFTNGSRGGRFNRRNTRFGRGSRPSNGFGSSFFCTHCNRPGHDIAWCYFALYNIPNPYPAYPYPYPTSHYPNTQNPLSKGPRSDHNSYKPATTYTGQNYSPNPAPYYPYYQSPMPSPRPSVPPYTFHGPQHPHISTYPPYAMNVSTGDPNNKHSLWFPDSGATNHITSDPTLVHQTTEQFCHEHLYMGNGTKEPISCSGTSTFTSPLHPHLSLSLHNLLLVPTITKNLISVSQFAKDNNCYFEFHRNDCFVKSQGSNTILLKGSLTSEGLYAFQILFPQKSANRASTPNPTGQFKSPFNKTIKAVQTDGGGEFRPFTNYLSNQGILHRLSCPHTHHQRGTVERKHTHIVETGLTLLAHAGLPPSFWEYAFTTAVYLINRLPSATLNNKSPHFNLFGSAPDYTTNMANEEVSHHVIIEDVTSSI
ncbi:PREDICTED: uncharacterized protein LOC109359670 [Lupinus angustifolius]|uniref:uncharacterized protein LOC109359670 n=1 Tax=Lupinus angustifolius TaxID=3871 RepID=UPI00092E9896|nr:PREDICTED: uncharacterized protein LOC109359670 [Lupinus angustifolius]